MSVENKPGIIHRRHSLRLDDADYGATGAYFVTLCTEGKRHLFGEVVDEDVRLNAAGRMLRLVWDALPDRFPRILSDAFVVMPNHIHAIIVLSDPRQDNEQEYQGRLLHREAPLQSPSGTVPESVGRIVQAFNSITTHEYTIGVKQFGWPPFPGKLWQRNYYERIIRNERELEATREYILNNPRNWAKDSYNAHYDQSQYQGLP